MEAKRKLERYLIPVYLIIEAGLLVVIKVIEGTAGIRTIKTFEYLAIVCDVAVTLIFYLAYGRKREERHENWVALGMGITLIADLFLTFIGGKGLFTNLGVFCFCLIEIVYVIYLKSPLPSIIARIVLFVALVVAALLLNVLTVTTGLAVLNISILLLNVIDAWAAKRFDPGILFQIGITLFFLGDICTGLREITHGSVHDVAAFLVWIFYLPTQVLITLHYVKRLR